MKNTTSNKGGVGRGNLVLPLRDNANKSIQLNYVRQDGIKKLYVNGILMSQDAMNYVTTDTGVDISRLQKWLDGNSMFSSSTIEKVVDGTTPPAPPCKANKLSKAVISAKVSANIAAAVEAHILRHYCPWAVHPLPISRREKEHAQLAYMYENLVSFGSTEPPIDMLTGHYFTGNAGNGGAFIPNHGKGRGHRHPVINWPDPTLPKH